MKRLKSTIFIGLIIITFTIFWFFYYFSNGTPWDKMSYKKQFNDYLVSKYNKDFEIEEISFDIMHGKTYHAYAHPIDQPKLTFYVGQNPTTKNIEDSYHSESWQIQAQEELDSIVIDNYPNNSNFAVTIIPKDFSVTEKSQIENYKEFVTVDVGISMRDYEITNENRESEVERAFLLLNKLKEHGVELHHFGISYQNKTLQLQQNEIELIKSIDDLDNLLKGYR